MSEENKPSNQPEEGTIEINNGRLILRVNLLQPKGKFLAKGLLMEAINVIDSFVMEAMMKKHRSGIIKPGIVNGSN